MLTDYCIYTIKHSDDLRSTFDSGGGNTYIENKRWVTAKKLLDKAKNAGKRLPIVFAPAEATAKLFAWALLDEVVLGDTTTYTFSDLRLFEKRPAKTTLRKKKNDEPLAKAFIRPYAICWKPSYLHKLEASGPGRSPPAITGRQRLTN